MYNLISLKNIISKIYSDLPIKQSDIPVTDIIEWSAEALEKIDAPDVYTHKVTGKEGIPLKGIKDYQAQLPMDCKQVIQVAYAPSIESDQFYPMKYASSSFSGNYGLTSNMDYEHIDEDETVSEAVGENDLVRLAMQLYDITYEEAVEKLNTDENVRSTLISLLSKDQQAIDSDAGTVNTDVLEYTIVPGYIKTNVREGFLMISYLAMPLDYEGYPMLPDEQSFKEALFWYVATKIFFSQWVTGELKDKELYAHAAQKWRFYVKQAYGRSMAPKTLDEHESLKNSWLRLIPKIDEGKDFFKNVNQQQHRKNH